jgi:hypothetical protein
MLKRYEWLLWLLVLAGTIVLLSLAWVRWGSQTSPLPGLSPEQRLAVYIGAEKRRERFSELRSDPLLKQEVHCEAEPLLTAEHFAEIRRMPMRETFQLWLEPTPAGKEILLQQADRYLPNYLVITVEGKELGAAKCGAPLPAVLLVPEVLGYAEPSRWQMEEFHEYLEELLFPADDRWPALGSTR